jgi:Tfp pilus assembly major pilin PilA
MAGSFRSFRGQLVSGPLYALSPEVGVRNYIKTATTQPTGVFKEMKMIMGEDWFKQRGYDFDTANKELVDLETRFKNLKDKSVGLSFWFSSKGDKGTIALWGAIQQRSIMDRLMKENPEISEEEARRIANPLVEEWTYKTQQTARAWAMGRGQKTAFGKFVTMFLNTPVRMNNLAIQKAQDLVLKPEPGQKRNTKEDVKSILEIAGYTLGQASLFNFVVGGAYFTMADEDLDEETKQRILDKKNSYMLQGTGKTIIEGTGAPGKLITTVYSLAEDIINNTDTNTRQKSAAKIILDMVKNYSPALGVKIGLAEQMSYDVKDAQKRS